MRVPYSNKKLLCCACDISLGDIHKLPTSCVLALFGIFYKFCFDMQTCHRIEGGVCVYVLKSVRKGYFRNVWVGGGVGHRLHHSALC